MSEYVFAAILVVILAAIGSAPTALPQASGCDGAKAFFFSSC